MGLHAIIYSIAFTIPAAIGFITFTAFTHLLTPYEYGVYSTGVNFGFFAGSVFFSWVRFSAGRYEAEARGDIALRFWTLCFVAMVPITAAIFSLISVAGFASPDILLSIFILSCSQSLFELSQEFRRAHRQSRQFAIYSTLRSLLAISLAIPAGLYLHSGLYLILSLSVSFLVAAFFNLLQQSRSDRLGKPQSHNTRTVLSYGFGLALSGLVFSSISVISRLMVVKFVGLDGAGPYNASLDLAGQIGGVIAMSVSAIAAPTIVKSFAKGDVEATKMQFRRGAELLLAVLLPSTAGLMLVAKPLATALTGAAFQDEIGQLLPLTILSVAIWNFNHHYLHIAFQVALKPFLLIMAGSVQIAAVLALSYVLILHLGIKGAAWALILANSMTVIVTFLMARRVFHIPIPGKALLKITICTGAMALVVFLLRNVTTSPLAELSISVSVGASVYGCLALAFNLCGCRDALVKILPLLHPTRQVAVPAGGISTRQPPHRIQNSSDSI